MRWKSLLRQIQLRLNRWNLQAESAEYQTWRHQFLLDRLQIALWIAFPVGIIQVVNAIVVTTWNWQQFEQDIITLYGDASLVPRMRAELPINVAILFGVLLSCWVLCRSCWGRQYPSAIFLLFSSVLTWSDMIVSTLFGIPSPPDTVFFLAQAVLIPVHWRLHLISQALPIAHYVILYRLLGLTKIGNRDLYGYYSTQRLIDMGWILLICILSVYLYEKLKRSEFESQRQLRSVIYAISHDLKTPIMGTSVTLQGLLLNPDSELSINRSILEQLLASSDRQLNLIHVLQEAQSAEIGAQRLVVQPISIHQIIQEVIDDLAAIVQAHHITISHHIRSDLPFAYANKTQIWRVLNNLISNALIHNPRGTQITISAEHSDQWIRCTVQDDGIGISPSQIPHLFKLYTRGLQSRRKPGLGLGLYLCQKIITAHQGEIGVISQPNQGSTFWFTLPTVES